MPIELSQISSGSLKEIGEERAHFSLLHLMLLQERYRLLFPESFYALSEDYGIGEENYGSYNCAL